MEFLKAIFSRDSSFLPPLLRSVNGYSQIEFSYFTDFCICIFSVWFSLKNPPMEGTVNRMKHKTRVFCQIDVQEFHLCTRYGRDILRVLIRSRI